LVERLLGLSQGKRFRTEGVIMFTAFFHKLNENNLLSYLAKMRNPQQVVVDLHAQGVDVCFDQAERLYHGIHEEGMNEDDVEDICGLGA
jgi:hypothetical protein